jgi:hypothetical protein
VIAVRQNFDVYLAFGNADEDNAQLEELEARGWDVGEQLSSNGLRQISKRHSDADAVLADLGRTIGRIDHAELVGSDQYASDVLKVILGTVGDTGPDQSNGATVVIHPRPDGSDSSADRGGAPSHAVTNGSTAQVTEAPAPEASNGDAQVIHEGALLLDSPPHLWDHISERERKSFALRVGTDLFRERVSYARARSWSISPESELLRRAAANSPLARRMLEVRAGLTEQDSALRRLKVEARKEEIALQRVLTATLEDFRAQVKKWTWLAGWAPYFLIATLLFAMAMTAWLIDVAASKLDGWALAPAIFALALFAISPVVLLLRERPLEGIDKWMPSGGSSGTATSSAPSDHSASSTNGAVTETTTSQTTSRPGPRIGGHKGERPN